MLTKLESELNYSKSIDKDVNPAMADISLNGHGISSCFHVVFGYENVITGKVLSFTGPKPNIRYGTLISFLNCDRIITSI